MEVSLQITLLIVITVVAGISAQVVASFVKLPSIIFLLVFGILLGPSGFNMLHPHLLGEGLTSLVSLSVALILFEGGLSLELREIEEVSGSIRNLVTVGTLITLAGGGMAAHWLGEFPWTIAFLYASLIVVTGPTVINPLLKQAGADRQISAILEGEGVLIDPIGAILSVVVLEFVLQSETDLWQAITELAGGLGLGALIGFSGGWCLSQLIKRANFLSDQLKNLVVLAGVWGLYGFSQVVVQESGLMTAVTAGIMMHLSELPTERVLRRFKGQLSTLAISVLFILLAADLSIPGVLALGWGGLWTVIALMAIVRPLNVLISTWNSDLNWRQKAFLAWIAPRGIVAASIASLFAVSLTNQGMNGGDSIKALVFLTIIVTVVLPGLTAQPLARVLKISAQSAIGVMIIGCHPLGRYLARLMQQQEPVVLVDTDPESCAQACQEGLDAFMGNALDMDVLQSAGLEQLGTLLVMTRNPEVNLVLAQRVLEEFHPPRVLAVFPPRGSNDHETTGLGEPAVAGIQRAFSGSVAIRQWSDYVSTGQVKLGEMELAENQPQQMEAQQAHLQALIRSGRLLPLFINRRDQLRIVVDGGVWQVGDRLTYLLHTPNVQTLPAGLTTNWQRPTPSSYLPIERLSQIGIPLLEREG